MSNFVFQHPCAWRRNQTKHLPEDPAAFLSRSLQRQGGSEAWSEMKEEKTMTDQCVGWCLSVGGGGTASPLFGAGAAHHIACVCVYLYIIYVCVGIMMPHHIQTPAPERQQERRGALQPPLSNSHPSRTTGSHQGVV